MNKVLLAVGGTGGHLFPAQALAEELLAKEHSLDLLFAGGHLDKTPFLNRESYRYIEVKSATPFRDGYLRSLFVLLRGIRESVRLLKKEKPSLVIGFGSYHCFPLLVAAKLRRIPLVLFEADTFPGMVNRLFSRFALFTATPFSLAAAHLKGEIKHVAMPSLHRKTFQSVSKEEARERFGLDPTGMTLLAFGGSQGARGINQLIPSLLNLCARQMPLQLIHLTGDAETSATVRESCREAKVACYVTEFEKEMGYIWKAADLFIGRAGASTLTEMIAFEVPGILIPYPHSSKAHQQKNAEFLENEVKGGVCLLENDASAKKLFDLLQSCQSRLKEFKQSLSTYNRTQYTETLGKCIYDLLSAR